MACFFSILVWERNYPQISINFTRAVVQATLLFGSETWVMKPRIRRNLGGFHHRIYLCLVGMKPTRYMAGRWEYPPRYIEMAAVGIKGVGKYVLH